MQFYKRIFKYALYNLTVVLSCFFFNGYTIISDAFYIFRSGMNRSQSNMSQTPSLDAKPSKGKTLLRVQCQGCQKEPEAAAMRRLLGVYAPATSIN